MSLPVSEPTPAPRRPRGEGWEQLVDPAPGVTMWRHVTGVTASSSLDLIDGDGLTWHVGVTQISASGQVIRAGRTAMRLVRWAFHMADAEEDNHAPLRVLRSLWLVVDRKHRKCACKAEEPEEVSESGAPDDADLYVWRIDRASSGG
jgi:hypothetical protein